MATRFIEYAAAPLGMPHDPSGTGMRRGTDAAKAGPPKRPAAVRVSKSLQGVSRRTQAVLRRRAL
jgi:hypothetical protein